MKRLNLFVAIFVLLLTSSLMIGCARPLASPETAAPKPKIQSEAALTNKSLVAERPTDAEAVFRDFFDAINAGDIDQAMNLVAEDAVFLFIPPPPGFDPAMDKATIRTFFSGYIQRNGHTKTTELYVHGDKVAVTVEFSEDEFTSIGVAPMVGNVVAIVQNGQLKTYNITFTAASQAKLQRALIPFLNKGVVGRFMEAWDKADLEALDEILAADFVNHSPSLPPDREGMMQVAADEHIGFPNNVWTIEQIVAEGDLVAVHLHVEGVHEGEFLGVPATGTEVDSTGTLIFRVQQGQITERWGDADVVSFLTSLGFELISPAE